ncbi:MAG: hypothetical protein H7329_03300 [Opitutaceae bacterium]|nr:hypothetical protein [Cytophagales bacterium]
MKKLVVPLAIGMIVLTSACSKKVIVSNGEKTKTFHVSGKIETHKDEQNNTITSFESVSGTKFNINTSQYALTIK